MDIRTNTLKNRKSDKWEKLRSRLTIAYLIAKQEIQFTFNNIKEAFAEINEIEQKYASEVGFVNYQILLEYR